MRPTLALGAIEGGTWLSRPHRTSTSTRTTSRSRRTRIPSLRRLREEAPLYYNERYDFYALSRYDDIERALKDKDTFINGKGNVLELIKADVEQPPGTLIFEDPPAHTLHRKLLSRAFTPKRVSALEQQIRDFTAECLDPLVGADGFDFVADLGAQVPMQVIGMLMGIPAQDRRTVREHVDGYLRTEPGQPMRFSKGSKWSPGSKLSDIFGEYIDWRAEHPSDDVMTDAAVGDVRGRARRHPDADPRRGAAVRQHRRRRRQRDDEPAHRLGRQGPRRPPRPAPRSSWRTRRSSTTPIEELLRFETPGPISGRYVAKDVELHGQTVPAGSALLLLNHSANRDERRYADPDRFDIHRTIGQHLPSGTGSTSAWARRWRASRVGSCSKRCSSGSPTGRSTSPTPGWRPPRSSVAGRRSRCVTP